MKHDIIRSCLTSSFWTTVSQIHPVGHGRHATMGLSTKNFANIVAFVFNMVVAAAIGFGLFGESNEFVSAK